MSAPAKLGRVMPTVAAAVFVADQISKAVVRARIEPGMPFQGEIFFHLTHHHNTGLVGGIFSGLPFIAYMAPIAALVLLLYLYFQSYPPGRVQAIAFGLVVGGAIGNIADRLMHGHVTDFLQFYFYFIPFDFPWKYYPAFNLADCGIVTGVFLLILTWNQSKQSHVSDDS